MDEHLLYVGGQWRPGRAAPDPATSPATGETFASVAMAGPGDVDDAVRAAARGLAGLGGLVGVRPGGLVRAGRRGHSRPPR